MWRMQGERIMSKQSLFNELLEDLIDACADYREAEHPASGQGSWTRSQLYAGVLRSVRDVVEVVNSGASHVPFSVAGGTHELGAGGTHDMGAGASAGATQQATVEPCICDEAELTISCVCAACGGSVANE
ncbi:hypothetical protein SEA_MOOKITTY_24 [Arthrobacter phage MooKitty]|nr:hypothetical protein SEA_MOOKITTY_24 [Arthrobacter phage MooKitty]